MYNLSDFMKTWEEDFTQSYNRRHDQNNNTIDEKHWKKGSKKQKRRVGTVWAGRFKSIFLNGTANLTLIAALYVDLNPVRAHMIGSDAGCYAWSGIGEALRNDAKAKEGILALGRWTGFADDESTAEEAVERYHNMLLGKAGGKIKEMLDTSFQIKENDFRFDKSLRGKRMTLFELLFCKCRCFEYGRALAEKASDLSKIPGSRPVESVIPGCYSANRLRDLVVMIC